MKIVSQFFQSIKVYDCGLSKERIGNRHDGGYVVLPDLCFLAPRLYSFGIGNDVSFELDYVSKFPGADILLFDPTIDALPQFHKNFTFYKQGIGDGHPRLGNVPQDAFLKMDVESYEWDAILGQSRKELKKFSQMVIEFHILHVEPKTGLTPYFTNLYRFATDKSNRRLFRLYYAALTKISEDFLCFHIHANNSLPLAKLDGITFPPLLEMSFVRKDLAVGTQLLEGQFPTPDLDFSNKTDRPDITGWHPIIKGKLC